MPHFLPLLNIFLLARICASFPHDDTIYFSFIRFMAYSAFLFSEFVSYSGFNGITTGFTGIAPSSNYLNFFIIAAIDLSPKTLFHFLCSSA